MISVTNLRPGTFFQENGEPLLVLSYEHTKLGRGTANIKLKIKNLKSKTVAEKTFISGAKVEEAGVEWREAQFLYKTSASAPPTRRASAGKQNFVFMDPKSYEQFGLGEEQVGEAAAYLKEGITVRISFYQGEPLSLELPMKMEFTIEETGPDIRGDSATNIWKTAALDNGLVIKVPLFIKTGEKILVDTRTGEYLQKIAQ